MKSNAKPILIETYVKRWMRTIPCSKLLLKVGDDMRQDIAVLQCFK